MSVYPLWIWIVGVVLLGGAIAYGILRTGRRNGRERALSENATKELYRREDRSA
jgi:hypothetical protein